MLQRRRANPFDGTAYGSMRSKIEKMLASFNISFLNTDAIEEIILKLMGIEEQPYGCRYAGMRKLGYAYCYFGFVISTESLNQLIKELNKRYPALEAKIIKDEQALELGVDTFIQGNSCVNISMKADAVEVYLLPEIESYLKQHPEEVSNYQGLSSDPEAIKRTFNSIVVGFGDKQLNFDDFVKSFYRMLLDDAPKASFVADILRWFSLDIVGIINGYLAYQNYKQNEMPTDVQVVGGCLARNPHSPFFTDFHVFYNEKKSSEPHKTIANFINTLTPGAAQIVDIEAPETKTTAKTGVIKIQNRGLTHEGLLFFSKEALKEYAEKKESSLTDALPNFNEEIITLRKMKKYLSEKKEYQEIKQTQELIRSLDLLIKYVEKGDFTNLGAYAALVGCIVRELHQIEGNRSPSLVKREEIAARFFNHSLTFAEIKYQIRSYAMESIDDKINRYIELQAFRLAARAG